MIVYDQETYSAAVNRATAEVVRLLIQEARKGSVNADNFNEVAEAAVDEIVNKLQLLSGDELVDIGISNEVLKNVLAHVHWY